jgi:hypothetical protein
MVVRQAAPAMASVAGRFKWNAKKWRSCEQSELDGDGSTVMNFTVDRELDDGSGKEEKKKMATSSA